MRRHARSRTRWCCCTCGDPCADAIDRSFRNCVEIVWRHRETHDHGRAQSIEFTRRHARSRGRTRIDRADEHLVEQVAIAWITRLDLRHGTTEATRFEIGLIGVASRLRLIGNATNDGRNAIRSAQVEPHGAATSFNRAVTTSTPHHQTLADGALALAEVVHAARRNACTRGTEQLFRDHSLGVVVEHRIEWSTRWVCLCRRELQNEVLLERSAIEGSKAKGRISHRREQREPISRVCDECCHGGQPIRHASAHGIVTRLEKHSLRALFQRRHFIRERLQAERLANDFTWQEKTVEAQPNARCRLHQIGCCSGWILRGERDRCRRAVRIRSVERSVDEMQRRCVDGLKLRRTDVASAEKNSTGKE